MNKQHHLEQQHHRTKKWAAITKLHQHRATTPGKK